jgi:hypothetical protein
MGSLGEFVPPSLGYRSPKNNFSTRNFLKEGFYTSVLIPLSENKVTIVCPGQVYFPCKYDNLEYLKWRFRVAQLLKL